MAGDESRANQPPEEVPIKPPARAAALQTAALPLSMVVVQVLTVVMLLLSKVALNTGIRPFVLIVYRNLIAAAAVAPLAFIFEREMWKKLNLAVLGWISLNATFGIVLAMSLYYYGLRATNPAYSAIFLNLIPIVTFVIAIVVGAERVALGKWHGRMELLGALMCVGGTMIVSMLKGRLLHLWPTHLLKIKSLHGGFAPATTATPHRDMVAGTLFLCGSCLSYALWFIVQGVFNTGITFVVISWVVSRRGPIYPPMFNSLSLIITTVMDSVLLGTNIYAGGVVGMLLVIIGLYGFLWGKGKDLQDAVVAKKLEQEEQKKQSGVEMA